MIKKEPFQNLINSLKESGKYRVFNDILREAGKFPTAIWYGPYNIKNIVNWCSNDYLGMGQSKVVLDAMHTARDMTGAGSGGTRNIGGTSHYHVALEHVGIAAQGGNAFLDTGAARVIEADNRGTDLHRLVHNLADLLGFGKLSIYQTALIIQIAICNVTL